jgi:hypothetical protein
MRELEAAVSAYYELGGKLRAYIPVARQYEQVREAFSMGQADAAALEKAEREKEDGALAVWDAKAAYAKSLLTLDGMLGYALTASWAEGELWKSAYAESLPEGLRGDGLWGIRREGDNKMYFPIALPSTIADAVGLSYRLCYNGQVIGESADGGACLLTNVDFDPAVPYAEIMFTDGDTVLETYTVDVFAPVGGFLQ